MEVVSRRVKKNVFERYITEASPPSRAELNIRNKNLWLICNECWEGGKEREREIAGVGEGVDIAHVVGVGWLQLKSSTRPRAG